VTLRVVVAVAHPLADSLLVPFPSRAVQTVPKWTLDSLHFAGVVSCFELQPGALRTKLGGNSWFDYDPNGSLGNMMQL